MAALTWRDIVPLIAFQALAAGVWLQTAVRVSREQGKPVPWTRTVVSLAVVLTLSAGVYLWATMRIPR